MIHIIKTPPATEPVTVSEMRQHLGITQAADTARDNIITGRIISARQWAEQNTRKQFITQTLTAYADDFSYEPAYNNRMDLKSPLVSVTSVKYLDSAGVLQTLDSASYIVDTVSACIIPAYGMSWPVVRAQNNAVQIEYVAGFGNAAAVPEPIKDAIRFIVGQWEVFQTSMEGVLRPFTIPNAAKELLSGYMDMREFF